MPGQVGAPEPGRSSRSPAQRSLWLLGGSWGSVVEWTLEKTLLRHYLRISPIERSRFLRMLTSTGLWVALSVVGIVWVSMTRVVVAAVVVGGKAERRLREADGDTERTNPTYSEAVGTPR